MNLSTDQHTPMPSPDETFPQEWLPYLQQNVFLYGLLSETDQARLRGLVPPFIAGKFWEGCGGLRLTEEIRVTIAAQACLLLLGFDAPRFDDPKTILVYPGGYLGSADHYQEDEGGRAHRLGEAHHGGPVVLSWWHACWGGRHRGAGNVVLHEFAHKLAERGDPERGIPPLDDPDDAERWEAVLSKEFDQLVEDAEYERPSLLDPYGGTSRTEFFAVASECFFLQPVPLHRRHPQLYALLAGWYHQDPAQWRIDPATDARSHEAWKEYIRHAIAECDAALRRHPDYLEAYWQRADCFASLGEFDRAVADYTQLVQLVPKAERTDVYHERGLVHLEAEAFEEAIADFSEAIRRRPDFAEAYRERGTAHALRGEQELALADFKRALQRDPRDDVAYLERGRVWCDREQYDRAVRDLTRAIRLSPHRAETYSQRALAYLGQQQYDLALADCEEALRLDPEGSEGYHVRAEIYAAKGDHERARQERDEAARREQ